MVPVLRLFRGPFSAVSRPIFATKCVFCTQCSSFTTLSLHHSRFCEFLQTFVWFLGGKFQHKFVKIPTKRQCLHLARCRPLFLGFFRISDNVQIYWRVLLRNTKFDAFLKQLYASRKMYQNVAYILYKSARRSAEKWHHCYNLFCRY